MSVAERWKAEGKLVRRRFPGGAASIEARVSSATEAELAVALDRIFDVARPEDLFD